MRVWRGVRGFDKCRICCGRRICLDCALESWEDDLVLRAEDGRRRIGWGVTFILRKEMESENRMYRQSTSSQLKGKECKQYSLNS